jgi:hypothetical protein
MIAPCAFGAQVTYEATEEGGTSERLQQIRMIEAFDFCRPPLFAAPNV